MLHQNDKQNIKKHDKFLNRMRRGKQPKPSSKFGKTLIRERNQLRIMREEE